jgi:polysaccharide biosynthesis/export protein
MVHASQIVPNLERATGDVAALTRYARAGQGTVGALLVDPTLYDQFVTVLGEVKTPGAIPLTTESTLPSVIAQAGGLGEGAGDSPKITLIQKSANTSRVISWKQVMTPNGIAELKLEPGDVIVVPRTGFYKVTYALQKLSPITSLLTIATLAGLP